jgi:hypothetical protein
MLEERKIPLCLQETDLKAREVILAEGQECGLHPTDGQDLSSELDTTQACMDKIDDEHAAKARQLSQLVMGISSVLVDLGMLPIQDIHQLPKSVREVLSMTDLVLKCLQKALAFGAGPWDLD